MMKSFLAQQGQLDKNSFVISKANVAQDAIALYEAIGMLDNKEDSNTKH